MQKTIKILSVISLCIILLSVVGLLVSYAFWTPLTQLFYNQKLEPSVPVASAFSLAVQLVTAVLIVIFAGRQRIGIWAEIVTVAWYGAGGIFIWAWSWIQGIVGNTLMASFFGIDEYSRYAMSNSVVSHLWNAATALNGVATTLLLFVCGLSIAYKIYLKKQLKGPQSSELWDKS